MSAALAPDDTRTTPVVSAERLPSQRFPASTRAIALNYLSAAALLLLGLAFYGSIPYYQELLTPLGITAIVVTLVGYLLILPFFYATFPDDYTVKCRLFWRALANLPRRRPTPPEAVALRAVAVKWFFMPLMIAWLAQGVQSQLVMLTATGTIGVYDLLFGLIIITDLFFFTIAYGIEHPRLNNEIRSVEPTLFGWAVALVCYPPFQLVSFRVLGWYPPDSPLFENPELQIAAGMVMLGLMGIYAWASVTLGLKASNLTNRGIVSHGPYAGVRHPAYLCKNAFWWVACGPLLIGRANAGDWQAFGLIVVSMAGWSAIYTLRAITEERHLMSDPDYRAYRERVKYRFIPNVW